MSLTSCESLVGNDGGFGISVGSDGGAGVPVGSDGGVGVSSPWSVGNDGGAGVSAYTTKDHISTVKPINTIIFFIFICVFCIFHLIIAQKSW